MNHVLVLVAIVVVIGTAFGIAQVWAAKRYRLFRGTRKTQEAIAVLVDDILHARESFVLAFEKCRACSPEDQQAIGDALRLSYEKARANGRELSVVVIWGGPAEHLPGFVRELERQGLIELHISHGRLPFTGRIVDGNLVEIHRGYELLPRSYVRAEHTAPGIAERLTEVALAS
jgi:hypothetical protein